MTVSSVEIVLPVEAKFCTAVRSVHPDKSIVAAATAMFARIFSSSVH
jgi:hypothetical protein